MVISADAYLLVVKTLPVPLLVALLVLIVIWPFATTLLALLKAVPLVVISVGAYPLAVKMLLVVVVQVPASIVELLIVVIQLALPKVVLLVAIFVVVYLLAVKTPPVLPLAESVLIVI